MFGLGFGEMVVLGVVLIVVVGPRELPKLLRTVGSGIRKLRDMSTDLREQSGIDEIINEEGLREDLNTIRSLSKGRMVEGLVNAGSPRPKPAPRRPRVVAKSLEQLVPPPGERPEREMEYPLVGADAYGALADDAPDPPPDDVKEAGPVEDGPVEDGPVEDADGAHEVEGSLDVPDDDEPLFDLSPPEGTVEANVRTTERKDEARSPAAEETVS